MSQLEWKWAYFPYLDAPEKQHESAVNAGYVKVVLKSEADKVIEFWKNESHEHYERWFNLNKKYEGWFGKVCRCERAERELRHQKYKRCLAMARWCDDAARLATWDNDYHRCGWYNKWMQRWFKIAEKFKSNNEVNNA